MDWSIEISPEIHMDQWLPISLKVLVYTGWLALVHSVLFSETTLNHPELRYITWGVSAD